MLRVRLPASVEFPDQMCALARISREDGDGILHVTDRQGHRIRRTSPYSH